MTEGHRSGGGAGSADTDRNTGVARLLRRCAAGDLAAREGLYDAAAPRVFGLVLSIVPQRHTAEEVTQQIFTQVWTQARYYEPSRGTALAWILAIAHRLAVARARRAGPHDLRDAPPGRRVQAGLESSAETSGSAEAAHVRAALTRLTPHQRTAIELAYLQGMTYPQIAAHLDITNGEAKSQITQGLRHLVRVFDQRVTGS